MQLSYMAKSLKWVVPGVQWCHQKPHLLVSFPSSIFSMLAFHLHGYHMVTRLWQPQASHSIHIQGRKKGDGQGQCQLSLLSRASQRNSPYI